MLEELILEAWERASRPPNREFVHSIIYGDAPVVVTLAKEVKRLKAYLKGDCESCFHATERSITSRECQKCKIGDGYKWKFKDATDGKEDTK